MSLSNRQSSDGGKHKRWDRGRVFAFNRELFPVHAVTWKVLPDVSNVMRIYCGTF